MNYNIGNIIVNALIMLNKKTGRKTITYSEINIFKENLKQKAKKNGETVGYDTYYSEYAYLNDILDILDDLTVEKDGERINVYRLKPNHTIDELKKYCHCYTVESAIFINDPNLIANLNDFTKKEEDEFLAFRRLDENYQLKAMYKLFELTRNMRKVESELSLIKSNSASLVAPEEVEPILEQNPDISFEKLNAAFEAITRR